MVEEARPGEGGTGGQPVGTTEVGLEIGLVEADLLVIDVFL